MKKQILWGFKFLGILLIATLLGILMWELYFAYGDAPESLQPEAFTQWKTKKILTSQRVVWIIVVNPEATGTIRAVAMEVATQDMSLLGYKYFENGRPRSFVYNNVKEKIVETELTSEQIRQCLGCHKYGQLVSEVPAGDAG